MSARKKQCAVCKKRFGVQGFHKHCQTHQKNVQQDAVKPKGKHYDTVTLDDVVQAGTKFQPEKAKEQTPWDSREYWKERALRAEEEIRESNQKFIEAREKLLIVNNVRRILDTVVGGM